MSIDKHVAIIGVGFCGLTTAMQIIRKAGHHRIVLHLINTRSPFGKGIAYGTPSKEPLLNVSVEKMSCFQEEPDHFLNWVMKQEVYASLGREIVRKLFVPRYEYGQYLLETWDEVKQEIPPNVRINMIEDYAIDMEPADGGFVIHFVKHDPIHTHYVALANGNEMPANPKLENDTIFSSPNYFQNPWSPEAVKNLNPHQDVLVIGNGLTMVDTVVEIHQEGFRKCIYSISPNGFSILPHRHGGVQYGQLNQELSELADLNSIFGSFRRHARKLRELGISAEPLVDSLRPLVQRLWMSFAEAEKRRFLRHLRHLWGVARHRLPTHIHDKIQNLRIQDQLIIHKGRLLDIRETDTRIEVEFYNGLTQRRETLFVGRVINCTGPQMDMSRSQNVLVRSLFRKGYITHDTLKLGLATSLLGEILDSNGNPVRNFFTLGANLRGMLWESTAVPELRLQAEKLASLLIDRIHAGQVEVSRQADQRSELVLIQR